MYNTIKINTKLNLTNNVKCFTVKCFTLGVFVVEFYGRVEELSTLNKKYDQLDKHSGVMTVITGRRRVGKTLLAERYIGDKESLYLFISKKSEKLLCDEFISIIKKPNYSSCWRF